MHISEMSFLTLLLGRWYFCFMVDESVRAGMMILFASLSFSFLIKGFIAVSEGELINLTLDSRSILSWSLFYGEQVYPE